MDEVEQDTSGFLPLVGITEVRKLSIKHIQLIKISRSCYAMLVVNNTSYLTLLFPDIWFYGSCADGNMDGTF